MKKDFMQEINDSNDSIVVNIIGKSYNTAILEKGYCKLVYGY